MRDLWTSEFGRELLAQREWLGGLAHALVRDSAQADDLVQETWMAALRTRPALEGGLRGWLATVLRNRASRAARDRHRREWKERLAARDDRDTSTRDVVERASTQQEVAMALMALDQPYRETILLRFYEELPPRAIAIEMGVPVSTVKTRLSRGLAKLASRLDERHGGDRGHWMMGLLALTEPGPRSSLLPFSGPVLAAWIAGVAVVGTGVVLVLDGSAPRSTHSVTSELDANSQAATDKFWRRINPTIDVKAPGLVTIPGGRTRIGTDSRELLKLLEGSREALEKLGGFRSETPRHEVVVDEFQLMLTEVTNEQYREYVQATGALPPLLWGEQAIGKARREFLEKDAEGRREARLANQPAPEREVFDPFDWWMAHGQSADWELPEEIARQPVVYVSIEDAQGYAEWAGLRLPTEYEFERAVRGDSDRDYPWGQKWKRGLAVIHENSKFGEVTEVGSNPEGANEQGVLDLLGNVWEWTSSSYAAYPGWELEARSFEEWAPQGALDSVPNFDPIRRVVRGGSAQTGAVFSRASTRGGFSPEQRASTLGFRCATSNPIREIAQRALDSLRASGSYPGLPATSIAFEEPLGLVGWRSRKPERRARDFKSKREGQGVIQDFAAVVILPVSHVQPLDSSKGQERSFVGLLTTADEIMSPKLTPGSWAVFLEPGEEASRASVLFVSLGGDHHEVRSSGELARDPVAASGIDAAPDQWLRLRVALVDRGQSHWTLSIELELDPLDWQILAGIR